MRIKLLLSLFLATASMMIFANNDVHNATIKNNTDIIINHQQNTIFNGEFKVEVGSTLLVE